METYNRILEALKNKNLEVLEELLHDDLMFNIPTGQTITKEMDIENYRSGVMNVEDITISDRTIKTFDTISTVVVTIHLKGKYLDQIIDGKFRYLRVWKSHNNSLKLIAGSGIQIL